MLITEILDKLKQNSKAPLTQEIESSLQTIQATCDFKYFDQSFFGNAALNRKILLDPEIAKHLTPEVLTYIFTNEPTSATKIKRNSSPGNVINLKDAIYYGFKEGLHVIHRMPNNERGYGPAAYEQQQQKFSANTMQIVANIRQAAGSEDIDTEQTFNPNGLIAQYDNITKAVNLIKVQGVSNELLYVPTYTPGEMRTQVGWGFKSICEILQTRDLGKETLDSFCEKFLKSPEAMLNGDVIHLFYDRAHILAALEQDTVYKIGDMDYTYQDIFKAMVQKVATNPELYPPCAQEQFCLRFGLLESDLQNRFKSIYDQAVASQESKELPLDVNVHKSPDNMEQYSVQSKAIDTTLDDFEGKMQSIGVHSTAAKVKAEELLKALRQLKAEVFQQPSKESMALFAERTKNTIKEATPVLQRDLGWGDYLANLARRLVNAVVTLAATLVSAKHHSLFAVKSSDAVNTLEVLEAKLVPSAP